MSSLRLFNVLVDAKQFLVAIILALVAAFSRTLLFSRKKYPPGPRALPIIGNLLDVPSTDKAKHYAEWKYKYGNICYFTLFGRDLVLLNDPEVVVDLFEKRSAIYCSRPKLAMAALCGRDRSILFLPYGKRFKSTRKLLHNFLNARASKTYWPEQEIEANKFVARLLSTPERLLDHVMSMPAANILKLVYGIQINYEEDRFVDLAQALAKITTISTEPGRWLVDAFPRLRFLPSWLPGAGFKRWAAEARTETDAFTRIPYSVAKAAMENGSNLTSFAAVNYPEISDDPEAEEILMYAAAGLYSGATDTIVSFFARFFLMMTNHPKIQARAQSEIDRVVGDDRMPDMSDRHSLPYIQCIMQELHRFNPIVPLVPHSPIEDDTYNGYHIPKGSWVMANVWAMTNDPVVYPDPHIFNPDRYNTEAGFTQPDPMQFTFGFGRRKCPGIHFADSIIFLTITRVLWALNISAEIGTDGEPQYPEVTFTVGHTVHPKPFRCQILPRSEARARFISDAAVAACKSTPTD